MGRAVVAGKKGLVNNRRLRNKKSGFHREALFQEMGATGVPAFWKAPVVPNKTKAKEEKSMALFSLHGVRFKEICYPDLEIASGKTTFVIGKSGSGKTTLLKLLNGVISPEAGTVCYRDKDVNDYDPIQLRREVLLASQMVYLFDKTIAENFAEYCAYRGIPCVSDDEMRRYLQLCALDFPLDAPCATMSGGERQRVYLAICLSFLPQALLLDEPTSALDDVTANTLLAGVKAFCAQHGITLIAVSHNRPIAEKYADDMVDFGEEGME